MVSSPKSGGTLLSLPSRTILLPATPDQVLAAVISYLPTAPEGVLAWQQDQATMLPGRWHARPAGGPLYLELTGGTLTQLNARIGLASDPQGCLARIEASYTPLARQRTLHAAQVAEGIIAGLCMSLRALAGSMPPARLNRRRSQRTSLVLPAQLRIGATVWAGSTADLSADGIGIHLPADIPTALLGEALQGHASGALQIEMGQRWITTRVRLIRHTPTHNGYTLGMRFAQPGEAARLQAHLTGGRVASQPRQGAEYRDHAAHWPEANQRVRAESRV